MSRSFRRTDVVVLAGILLTLMVVLVAANHARKDALRMSCANNMHQCALALIQYQNAYNMFPPSEFTETGWSGMVKTMPYLATGMHYNGHDADRPRWAPENKDAVAEQLDIFICPANPHTSPVSASNVMRLNGTTDPGSNRYAMSHYAANWGGGRGPFGQAFTKADGAYRGVMRPDFVGKVRLKPIADVDITDGKSTTLLLVEKRDSQGWAVGGWAGSEFDVGNAPTVKATDSWGDKVYSGSYHEGGVNATFCDGSVRFLTTTMNQHVWFSLIIRDGKEPLEYSIEAEEFLIESHPQDGK